MSRFAMPYGISQDRLFNSLYDLNNTNDLERAIKDLSYMWIIGVFPSDFTPKVFNRIDELQNKLDYLIIFR